MARANNPWHPITKLRPYRGNTYLLRARHPSTGHQTEAVLCTWDRTLLDDKSHWIGWEHEFPPTHWAHDPRYFDLPQVYSDGKSLSLWERERRVLEAIDHEEWAFGFDSIMDATRLDRACVRRMCRLLARKGDAKFMRALTTEDGEMAGAGYGITSQGQRRLAIMDKGNPKGEEE